MRFNDISFRLFYFVITLVTLGVGLDFSFQFSGTKIFRGHNVAALRSKPEMLLIQQLITASSCGISE